MMIIGEMDTISNNGVEINNEQEYKIDWNNHSPVPERNYHRYQYQKGKDNQKTYLSIIVLILTIALIALSILFGIIILSQDQTDHQDSTESDEYIKLKDSYDDLNNQHKSLQTSYEQLDSQNTLLQTTNTNLQSDYNQLEAEYNTLQSDYDSLTTEYITLLLDYYALNDNYVNETTMGMGHLLNDYYEVIREEITPTGWWIYQPTNQDFADFAANIAEHGLGITYWPDYEDEFYQKSERAYGSKIHSYKKALDQLNAVKNLIDITEFDENTLKIDKILDFINDNVHYEPDMDDNFLAPMETLSLKSGDCEDYSILAGALFELVNIESAIAIGEKSGTPHAFVLVKLDNLGTHGCWHFDDLTSYGLSSGQWIIIEPQARIEQQGDVGEDITLNVATEISG